MADRKCELLRADREAALAEKRQLARDLGAHELLQRLDAVYAALQQEPSFQTGRDFSVGYVEKLAEEVKAALATLGVSAEKLDSVRVVATLSDAVSAQMTPFSDGSGLVLVSDGVISTCSSYCQYDALYIDRWLDRRRLQASVQTRMYKNADVLTGLLRYHTTNQRVTGVTTQLGMRLSPRGQQVAWRLNGLAYRFVIAHEIAHHVLGHSSAPSSFAPGEHVPVCSENERRERDADLLAFRATRRASEIQEDGRLMEMEAVASATKGALIAMLSLDLTEQALFVRRGCTHPPASIRAAWLLEELDGHWRKVMRRFLRIPVEATAAAALISENASPFSWESVSSAPIYSPMPQSHISSIGELDALQCLHESVQISVLKDQRSDSLAWLAEGARLASEGNPMQALVQWGLSESTSHSFCHPQRALTFFTLKDHLAASFAAQGVTGDWLQLYSVIAANLLASRLNAP
ncbi:hypothetical protein ABZY30_35220 [Streptomyces massasporeus]|uniref:ImmA/IrrE family metallo-endopeptidase n=1 Tax=Streptomyces massasporeus TaxID=67324 RepID=UPI0033BCBF4C